MSSKIIKKTLCILLFVGKYGFATRSDDEKSPSSKISHFSFINSGSKSSFKYCEDYHKLLEKFNIYLTIENAKRGDKKESNEDHFKAFLDSVCERTKCDYKKFSQALNTSNAEQNDWNEVTRNVARVIRFLNQKVPESMVRNDPAFLTRIHLIVFKKIIKETQQSLENNPQFPVRDLFSNELMIDFDMEDPENKRVISNMFLSYLDDWRALGEEIQSWINGNYDVQFKHFAQTVFQKYAFTIEKIEIKETEGTPECFWKPQNNTQKHGRYERTKKWDNPFLIQSLKNSLEKKAIGHDVMEPFLNKTLALENEEAYETYLNLILSHPDFKTKLESFFKEKIEKNPHIQLENFSFFLDFLENGPCQDEIFSSFSQLFKKRKNDMVKLIQHISSPTVERLLSKVVPPSLENIFTKLDDETLQRIFQYSSCESASEWLAHLSGTKRSNILNKIPLQKLVELLYAVYHKEKSPFLDYLKTLSSERTSEVLKNSRFRTESHSILQRLYQEDCPENNIAEILESLDFKTTSSFIDALSLEDGASFLSAFSQNYCAKILLELNKQRSILPYIQKIWQIRTEDDALETATYIYDLILEIEKMKTKEGISIFKELTSKEIHLILHAMYIENNFSLFEFFDTKDDKIFKKIVDALYIMDSNSRESFLQSLEIEHRANLLEHSDKLWIKNFIVEDTDYLFFFKNLTEKKVCEIFEILDHEEIALHLKQFFYSETVSKNSNEERKITERGARILSKLDPRKTASTFNLLEAMWKNSRSASEDHIVPQLLSMMNASSISAILTYVDPIYQCDIFQLLPQDKYAQVLNKMPISACIDLVRLVRLENRKSLLKTIEAPQIVGDMVLEICKISVSYAASILNDFYAINHQKGQKALVHVISHLLADPEGLLKENNILKDLTGFLSSSEKDDLFTTFFLSLEERATLIDAADDEDMAEQIFRTTKKHAAELLKMVDDNEKIALWLMSLIDMEERKRLLDTLPEAQQKIVIAHLQEYYHKEQNFQEYLRSLFGEL